MGVLIIEGTLEEIKKKLDALPHSPDRRLRVMVRELNRIERKPDDQETLSPIQIEQQDGIPLIPHHPCDTPVTPELVKQLLDEEDEELIHASRTNRR
jgi:hypothetical protein